MLKITENEKTIQMKIEMTIPQSQIFEFLQKKGYEVKSWLWQFTDETFPGGVTAHEVWTFTATKIGEFQCEDTIYTKVLDKEVKRLLNLK
ncbi:hypothetical protein [Chryseobacterium salviniae]|uniref:Activator of Hsp90 ATPase homolog 1-like protein n=1 Tax=Chryseobacterium salviniae TaxID=3101750 RepID=A0ABU6HSD2_9FLAO|nr:hypothetical protein [Chryseobacterium sp. T9W2-O]MEC3875955.1 hypothetical protein [Chryseobacterium sp. T9W2-O]